MALSELPPEIRPLVRQYAENMQDGAEIRSKLGSAMTTAGLRWHQVDRLAHELAYAGR